MQYGLILNRQGHTDMRSTLYNVQTEFNDESDDYEVLTVTDKGTIFKNPMNELIWMEMESVIDGSIGEVLTAADGKLW